MSGLTLGQAVLQTGLGLVQTGEYLQRESEVKAGLSFVVIELSSNRW